jgi:hypothetical protein
MATIAPSRAVISRWLTEVAGEPIGTAPEKRCANGVLYCKLLDSVRPGVVNMAKVNLADSEHASLANYRLLSAGLEKAGVTNPIDSALLSKGQPQATLELLHRLFALSGQQAPAKGLAPLDPNAFDEGGRRGKRRAGAPPAAAPPKRAASRSKNGDDEQAADGSASAAAEAEATPVEVVLRQQVGTCPSGGLPSEPHSLTHCARAT